jgi:thiol-disulfide isomerase/thioredoxin
MRKTIVAIGLLFAITACNTKKDGYTIEGTLAGIDSGKVIINNYSEDHPIADTTAIKNGKFTFTGKVTTPELFTLYIDGEEGGLSFFLANGKISIIGEVQALHDASVAGPNLTMEAKSLMNQRDSIFTQVRNLFTPEMYMELENPATPEKRKAELMALYEEAIEKVSALSALCNELYDGYVKANPHSALSVFLVASSLLDEYTDEELSALVANFKTQPELAENRFLKIIEEHAKVAAGDIEVDRVTPDFTQEDPDGNPITFSTIYKQNKLTMIDFWASWCGPCRQFNPTLVKLYEQYHPKGFEILAVSFDNERENWLGAIANDKLTWPQVSNLQGRRNVLGKQFGVPHIPYNVLVNAEGVIVAKGVEGDELEQFLQKQLN